MKIAFDISDARQAAGVTGQLAAYNAGQPPETAIAGESAFILAMVQGQLNEWADKFDVATTSDKKYLEDAIIADQVAVKAAIEARRAKEAGGVVKKVRP